MPDSEAPRLLCVEVYEGRPLSYMTETAAGMLAELTDRCVFVPTTTRTREQYRRVRLPGGPARYAVCANGGHLLVDGEPDPDWNAQVRRGLAGCAPLEEVCAHLRGASSEGEWVLKQRVADELFAYLVVDRSRLPQTWVKELTAWAEPRGWTVSLQGRKIYAVPGPLTKSAAVAEVARRTGATYTCAAGDSLLDADMLLAADEGWFPGHGELAGSGWSAGHITALSERGVAAGERIVREMRERTGTASRPTAPGPGPGDAPGPGGGTED
ncbi:HAD family hydrolase [Streptomyces abyssalis]|nr:HAD family hydrolase [Streptomyces abyssalis]